MSDDEPNKRTYRDPKEDHKQDLFRQTKGPNGKYKRRKRRARKNKRAKKEYGGGP